MVLGEEGQPFPSSLSPATLVSQTNHGGQPADARRSLHRELGLVGVVALSIGAMIGSGTFGLSALPPRSHLGTASHRFHVVADLIDRIAESMDYPTSSSPPGELQTARSALGERQQA